MLTFKEQLVTAIHTLAQANGWQNHKHTLPTYDPLPPLSVCLAIADEAATTVHQPASVRMSYMVLKQALIAQYNALQAVGLQVYPHVGQSEPYTSSDNMRERVTAEQTFYFLPTDTAYGSGANVIGDANFMLQPTNAQDSNGTYLLLNDVFRIVHDMVAHFIGGYSFSGRGEYNGYLCHVGTLPSAALAAITAETVCQTMFFEFGPHLRRADNSLPTPNDLDFVPRSQRPFARQINYYPKAAMDWYLGTVALTRR